MTSRSVSLPQSQWYSQQQPQLQQQQQQNKTNTFPMKLYKLLEYAEKENKTDVISWTPHGRSFKVHDKDRFLEELMPIFFSTSNYQTFQRNLNLWGFRTMSKGLNKGECSNPNFQRGRADLCSIMNRIRIKAQPNPPTSMMVANPTLSTRDGSLSTSSSVQGQSLPVTDSSNLPVAWREGVTLGTAVGSAPSPSIVNIAGNPSQWQQVQHQATFPQGNQQLHHPHPQQLHHQMNQVINHPSTNTGALPSNPLLTLMMNIVGGNSATNPTTITGEKNLLATALAPVNTIQSAPEQVKIPLGSVHPPVNASSESDRNARKNADLSNALASILRNALTSNTQTQSSTAEPLNLTPANLLSMLLNQQQQKQSNHADGNDADRLAGQIQALQHQVNQLQQGISPSPGPPVDRTVGSAYLAPSDVSSTTSKASSNAFSQQPLSETMIQQNHERNNITSKSVAVEKPLVSVVKSKQKRDEALQRGSVIAFCKARGMPMDHSGHTAFFEILPGMPHGTELICSHAVCRNGGVKFLYCAFCDMPVARRSFRAQHEHSEEQNQIAAAKAKKLSTNDSNTEPVAKQSGKRTDPLSDFQGRVRKRSRHSADPATNAESQPQIPSLLVDLAIARLDAERLTSDRNSNDSNGFAMNAFQNNIMQDGNGNMLAYRNRTVTPGSSETATNSDGDSNGAIGNAILRGEIGEASDNGSDDYEETQVRFEWLQLLQQRRKLRTSTDLSAWLLRVLSVSNPYRRDPHLVPSDSKKREEVVRGTMGGDAAASDSPKACMDDEEGKHTAKPY